MTRENSSSDAVGSRLVAWLDGPRRLARTILAVFHLFDSARVRLIDLGAHEMAAQVQAAKDLFLFVASVAALNCLVLAVMLAVWWFGIIALLARVFVRLFI